MRKSLKAVIAVVLIAALAGAYLYASRLPIPRNFEGENPFKKGDGSTAVVAHRGGGGEFPENTLEAFYNAYSVDKNVIYETDVNITKDGVLILLHNELLDKTTNVTGPASEWNYTDLVEKRVNFGYDNPTEDTVLAGEREYFKVNGERVYPTDVEYPEGVEARDEEIFLVTTFEEVLVAFPDSRMSVEIKQGGENGIKAAREMLRLVEKHDAFDRIIFATFHANVGAEFERWEREGLVPDNFMRTAELFGVLNYLALSTLRLNALYTEPIVSLQLPMEKFGVTLATEYITKNAAQRNIAIMFWTVNDEDDMRELVELGVDGVMTDYPSRLKGVIDEYDNS